MEGNKNPPPPTPDRVVVKFRPGFAPVLEGQLPSATLKLTAPPANAALRDFFSRHKVKDLAPLHPQHVRQKLAGASPRDIAERARARFAARTSRSAQSITPPDLTRTYVLNVDPRGTPLATLVAGLKADPNVEFAEPDRVVSVQLVPNDPYFSTSGSWGWAHEDLYGLKKIAAPAAWDVTNGSGIVVAVIDTGIDYNHADLAANVWTNAGEIAANGLDDDGNGFIDDVRGWDFIGVSSSSPVQDNNPSDGHGHGTHVAGTIAATGNNAVGVIGVAFGARVMAVKGIADNGYGADSSLSAALRYAADQGADVINNSWAGTGYSAAVHDALAYAYSLGAVIVSAAGNANRDVAEYYPANSTYSLAVSAYDWSDARASFSNWGGKIDVAAPGANVLSLRAANTAIGTIVGDDYLAAWGTSMASPHVAGLAALILAQNPAYTSEQVRQAIRVSADDIDAAGHDIYSGYGRINAARALKLATVAAAKIHSPGTGSRLTSATIWPIAGEASGPTFASYTLAQGYGDAPATWTTLAQSTTAVSNGNLGSFDPGGLVDGRYTVRLTVTDTAAQSYRDQITLVVDKTAITAPLPPNAPPKAILYRPGATIAIRGRAIGPGFQGYRVEWSRGMNGEGPWSATGVSLVNGGAAPISDGALATWNTSGIAVADYYQIRVVATHSYGFSDDARTLVYIEPDLTHAAWPQSLADRPLGPVTAGLNAAGQRRMLLVEANARDMFAPDGSSFSQFLLGSRLARTAATHNLDGSIGDKTVLQDGSQLRIINANDTSTAINSPVPATFNLGEMFPIVLSDLDGDGFREIIAAGRVTGSNTTLGIFAFKQNGQPFSPQYPITVPTQSWVPAFDRSRVLVVDLDNDGNKELIVVSADDPAHDTLRLYRADGTRLTWADPVVNGQVIRLIAADVDQDGQMEVVMSYRAYYPVWQDYIAVMSPAGAMKPGWPVAATSPSLMHLSAQHLAVADLKGDGTRKIIAGGGHALSVYNADGTMLTGWPRHEQTAYFGPFAIGDITGDGVPELITARTNIVASIPSPFLPEDGGQPALSSRPIAATGDRAARVEDRIRLADGNEALVLASQGGSPQSGTTTYVDASVLVLGADNTLLRTWRMQGLDGKGVYDDVWATIGDFDGSGAARVAVTHSTSIDLGDGSTMTSGGVLSVYGMGGAFVADRQPWPQAYANPQNTMTDKSAEATPPGIAITAPASSATVAGNVTVTASAINFGSGVAGVQFKIDGANIGAEDTVAPYSFVLDTTTLANGAHTLTAVARDNTGRTPTSASVGVTVNNLVVKVNFQPAAAAPFSGYLVDGGATYADRGNGYSYGWNSSQTGNAFDRNSALSLDQRYDTLIAVSKNVRWEIGLPNGTYRVRLVAGDPTSFDTSYKFAVEGTTAINGVTTSANRWLEGTVQVVVSDGRLTLTGLNGAKNNKLCFVDIVRVGN